MVDFRKLRSTVTQQSVHSDPIEIFRRLPKSREIQDLYTGQAETLKAWYASRSQRDVVIKLHTGGGKTLVGLLIAQSTLNEHRRPVIYVCPTTQLVEQTLKLATQYNIHALPYQRSSDPGKRVELPEAFWSGSSVMVCTYQALFNGRSRFGVRGKTDTIELGGIILDDAHVALSSVRESFTIRIDRRRDGEAFKHLTTLFRSDFKEIGRQGSFDDIVMGSEYGVLEVPYWSWQLRCDEVREYLAGYAETEALRFHWSLLRDNFMYCHCLVGHDAVAITPLLPLVNLIPAFEDCPRRIYMSATIADDSSIIHTFDANPDHVCRPITSSSLAGVSERMILVPELTSIPELDVSGELKALAQWAASERAVGTVILVPSGAKAQE